MLKDAGKALGRFLQKAEVLQALANWLLLAIGAVVLVRGAYVVFGDATAGLALLGGGAVLLFAGSIDRFESLKGLGIEAKTREITRKLERADFLLAQLQQLSINVNGGLIKQAAGSRYWDTAYDDRDLMELADVTRGQLLGVGVDEDRIAEVLRPWANAMLWCWACEAFKPWRLAIEETVARLQEERSAVIAAGNRDDPRWAALPEQIQALQKFQSDTSNYLYRLRVID